MKCFYHSDTDAVANCSTNCGKSLCQECASCFTPILCRECFQNVCITTRQQAKSDRVKAFIVLAWNAFFLIAGIITIIEEHMKNPDVPILTILFLFWGISGLPWVLMKGILSDNSIESQVDRAISRNTEPGAYVIGGLFGFFIKLFLGFAIGAIASPILLMYNIYSFMQKSKLIKQMDANLEALTQAQ